MRLAVALLLILSACTPTLTQEPAAFALTYDGKTLRADAAGGLEYVVARARGLDITSEHCLTPGCPAESDGFVYVSLTPRESLYPPDVALATGDVTYAEAVAHVGGERESRSAVWPPRTP